MLDVTKTTIRRWEEDGTLSPAVREDGVRVFSRRAVELLRARRARTARARIPREVVISGGALSRVVVALGVDPSAPTADAIVSGAERLRALVRALRAPAPLAPDRAA